MGVSACIISKNEEGNIKRCLDSLKNAVDEIILIDTGSEDNTIEIAKTYGAKVYNHPWNQDFSEVRNVSLEKANEDWLLIIDCDEELDSESIPRLKELARADTPFEGFGVIISNLVNGNVAYVDTTVRLIRNDKKYKFHGTLHEQIGDVIVGLKGPYSILSSQIKLRHYGYDEVEVLKKEKIKRNISILNNIPAKNRDGLYYLHLANEYSRMKDNKKALSYYKESFRLSEEDSAYFIKLCHRLMESLYNNEDYKGAVYYGNYILKIFPDFKVIHFLKAICHIKLKQYKEALTHLTIYTDQEEQLLSKYPNVDYDTIENINDLKRKLESVLGV